MGMRANSATMDSYEVLKATINTAMANNQSGQYMNIWMDIGEGPNAIPVNVQLLAVYDACCGHKNPEIPIANVDDLISNLLEEQKF